MSNCLQQKLAPACTLALLLVLALYSQEASADYEKTCNYLSRPHRRGLCGASLADVIADLCSNFAQPAHTSMTRITKRKADMRNSESLKEIMLHKKDAFSYLAKRQTTGTITCECCYNACSVDELLQYCDVRIFRSRRSPRFPSLTSQQDDQTSN
jgi:hypothetical protein